MAPSIRPRAAAFTLIEIMAVVLIIALASSLLIPNLGSLRERALQVEAERLAAQLELARERTVVTGVHHRLLFDLEESAYRMEWLAEDPEADEPLEEEPIDLRGQAPIPMSPPRGAEREYRPLPGLLGRFTLLEESLWFAGLETPAGFIEQGEVGIAFERDGTTDYTAIVLEAADGRTLILDVLPLANAVRVRDEAL